MHYKTNWFDFDEFKHGLRDAVNVCFVVTNSRRIRPGKRNNNIVHWIGPPTSRLITIHHTNFDIPTSKEVCHWVGQVFLTQVEGFQQYRLFPVISSVHCDYTVKIWERRSEPVYDTVLPHSLILITDRFNTCAFSIESKDEATKTILPEKGKLERSCVFLLYSQSSLPGQSI